jgi:hypothetical protein
MPTDLLEERQLSRSALRHRPIAPDAINTQVSTPRASQARQKHEPHTTGGPPSAHTSKRGPWLIYLVLGMLMVMMLLWLGQMLWSWVGTVSDDIHYGRPRTTQIDHFVGHETGKTPSHFIADIWTAHPLNPLHTLLSTVAYILTKNAEVFYSFGCLFGATSICHNQCLKYRDTDNYPTFRTSTCSIRSIFRWEVQASGGEGDARWSPALLPSVPHAAPGRC